MTWPRLYYATGLLGLLASVGLNVFLLQEGTSSRQQRARADAAPFIVLNEDIIRGLSTHFDVSDPDQVLRAVLSKVGRVANVYPTENYYYFRMYADGHAIAGNIMLAPEALTEGRIHLAYAGETGDGVFDTPDSFERAYSAANGVLINNLGDRRYAVSFQGVVAEFHLSELPFEVPAGLQLASDEIYLGPIQDESGIKFSLLFNGSDNYFFYLLDERGRVPDRLVPHQSEALIARRTGFAFFHDEKSGRKLLIAVNRQNVVENNYHDGPFDQIPYNYVKQSRIKDYIERAFPNLVGKIDQYGNFLGDDENKVGIISYRQYEDRDTDLAFVDKCKQDIQSRSRFYLCLIGLDRHPPAP